MLTVVQTGASFLQLSPVALLPVIKSELHVSVMRAAVLAAAINAGTLLAAVPAGQITNRLGERRTLTAGCAIAGVAVIVAAFVSDVRLMLPPLLAAGVGVVASHTAGIRLIMRRFDVRQRGGAIAIRQTAVPLGGTLAALTLPPLALLIGWRGDLVASGALALLLAVLAWRIVPDREPAASGAQATGSTLARVLCNRAVALGVLLSVCFNVGQVVVVTFIGLYAHDELGGSVALAAGLLALVQASSMVGRIIWGVLSDRLYAGRRRPLLVWLGLGGAVSLFALGLVQYGTPTTVLVLAALLAGLTVASWQGLTIALTAEAAGLAGAATAMSLIVMVVYFVNATVPLVGGLLADGTGSYRAVWYVAAAVLLVSPLLTALVHERREERGMV